MMSPAPSPRASLRTCSVRSTVSSAECMGGFPEGSTSRPTLSQLSAREEGAIASRWPTSERRSMALCRTLVYSGLHTWPNIHSHTICSTNAVRASYAYLSLHNTPSLTHGGGVSLLETLKASLKTLTQQSGYWEDLSKQQQYNTPLKNIHIAKLKHYDALWMTCQCTRCWLDDLSVHAMLARRLVSACDAG